MDEISIFISHSIKIMMILLFYEAALHYIFDKSALHECME